MPDIVYFDLETQHSAAEVGGWLHKRDMKMSLAATFSTAAGEYRIYDEARVQDLIRQLMRADLVVGFNILRFDYEVLAAYTPLDISQAPTLVLMLDLESKLGHRLSLEAVTTATLNAPKLADGMQALRWWKEGRLMELAEYCCFDVKLTKLIHEFGRTHGHVFYFDRFGQKRPVNVRW
ncbi:MAG: helicase [Verrucomicrobiae bacterium]|nr:helicase [Verrucomicrobiae bacterium]